MKNCQNMIFKQNCKKTEKVFLLHSGKWWQFVQNGSGRMISHQSGSQRSEKCLFKNLECYLSKISKWRG